MIKEQVKKHIILILISIVAIIACLIFAAVSAKYVADANVTAELKLTVNTEYTIDKSKLHEALQGLSTKPTTLKFVKGSDEALSGLTSLSADGIQDDSIYSNKIGVFQSGSTVYIAPMAATGTSPANTDKVMYAPVDSEYLLGGDDTHTNLGTNLTSIDCANLDTSKTTSMNRMFMYQNKAESINVSSFDTSKTTKMQSMFNRCNALKTVDLSAFNTSDVTTMAYMFVDCFALTDLDLSNFNTAKVTNMCEMFNGCNSLSSLNISKFNTSQVTNMYYMFGNCSSMTTLNLSHFDTSEVINMSKMFYKCYKLSSVNVSSFDTSKVTDMSYMFAGSQTTDDDGNITYYPNQLTTLDLSSFDTSSVKNFKEMFSDCRNLTNLSVSSSFTGASATTTSYMFLNDNALTNLDLSSFSTSSALTDCSVMFGGCNNLKTLKLSSSFNTSKVTTMERMFSYCNELTSLDLSSFDTSSVTTQENMFRGNNKLQKITLGAAFDFVGTNGYLPTPSSTYIADADGKWKDTSTSLTYTPANLATFHNASTVVRTYEANKEQLTYTINKTTMYTALQAVASGTTTLKFAKGSEVPSDATNTYSSGIQDSSLSTGEIGVFQSGSTVYIAPMDATTKKPKITDAVMYAPVDCSSFLRGGSAYTALANELTNVDFSNMDTSKTTAMQWMFYDCRALKSITFGDNFKTDKVTSMRLMFGYASTLETLDLSGFNTSNVADMARMFNSCAKLTKIDFSDNFKTSSATDMGYMFYTCRSLTSLDLSSFNTSKVTNMSSMFGDCDKLATVTLGANFDFVGTEGYLPEQTSSSITGADGKWYDMTTNTGYTPANLAKFHNSLNKERAYTAVSPTN